MDNYDNTDDILDAFEDCDYIRNNPLMKAPNQSASVDIETFKAYTQEIVRCIKDVKYFANNYYTILSLDHGETIISTYPKQDELLDMMNTAKRLAVLASRQVGKTTSYSIFSLWKCCFTENFRILILANREKAAIGFLNDIKRAYELLPKWLKPGVAEVNKTKIKFSNGSEISVSTTTPTAARGSRANILIIDEIAFIPANIIEELWAAVYPIISSSKESQVFMVSTPNGVGDLFHKTYTAGLSENTEGWKSFKFMWYDVPGRDEQWKQQQLAAFNYDYTRFNQEFGCQFLGSSYILVSAETIEMLEQKTEKLLKASTIKTEEFGEARFNILEEPIEGHCYVIGADIADGIGGDNTVIKVFDITDAKNIKEVAYLKENTLSTVDVPFILAKKGLDYNIAPILIESNFDTTIIKLLQDVYEYENIVRTKRGSLGIYSTANVKVEACLILKNIFEDTNINIELFDLSFLDELKYFEKRSCGNKYGYTYGTKHKNDDSVLATIWAFYIFNKDLLEYHFDIKYEQRDGKAYPSQLTNFYKKHDVEQAKRYFNDHILKSHSVLMKKEDVEQDENPINDIFNVNTQDPFDFYYNKQNDKIDEW